MSLSSTVAACRPLFTSVARAYSTAGKPSAIGFIGLGNMGGHMVRNLVKGGHKVTVFDVNSEATAKLSAEHSDSVTVAACPAEVAEDVSSVVTMLPSNPHVQEVYGGSKGIFQTVKAGTLCIDASTIAPNVAQQVAEDAQGKGVEFVDAPVSGGVGGAEAGTLTFMVGGTDGNFSIAKPILENMGKNIVHCGAVGTGQAAKICNNMMLAISMVGVSETMNLGARLGIDPKLLAGIINTSSGRCWASDTYNPFPGVMEGVPASRGYTGGFGSALMHKDLGLAMSAASDTKSGVPLGALSYQIYSVMLNAGYGGKDFSSVCEFLDKKE